jgi:hypothetical protein
MQAVHLQHTSSDQPTECVAELLSNEQSGIPLAELLFAVPRTCQSIQCNWCAYSPSRKVIQGTRKEDRLGCTWTALSIDEMQDG